MIVSYTIFDNAGRRITASTGTCFLNLQAFRRWIRKEMARFDDAYICKWYELGIRNARVRTITSNHNSHDNN